MHDYLEQSPSGRTFHILKVWAARNSWLEDGVAQLPARCRVDRTDGAELDEVAASQRELGRLLTFGFNRRFAPHVRKIVAALARRSSPTNIVVRVNAGAIPETHWIQRPEEGGGRISGERRHFVDLAACRAWTGYDGLPRHGCLHGRTMLSSPGDRARISMPRMHRVAARFGRSTSGAHESSVTPGHIQSYLEEVTCRS